MNIFIASCGKSATAITCREQEIVSFIARGSRNQEVANHFGLSESTIKQHLRNIFKKLGARNRVEAVRIASERGLLLN